MIRVITALAAAVCYLIARILIQPAKTHAYALFDFALGNWNSYSTRYKPVVSVQKPTISRPNAPFSTMNNRPNPLSQQTTKNGNRHCTAPANYGQLYFPPIDLLHTFRPTCYLFN